MRAQVAILRAQVAILRGGVAKMFGGGAFLPPKLYLTEIELTQTI